MTNSQWLFRQYSHQAKENLEWGVSGIAVAIIFRINNYGLF